METLFNFSHEYDKLQDKVFTTIRATSKKVEKGDEGWITINREKAFKARVIDTKDMRIMDMPLELLKRDVAPFEIETRSDFVAFLNTLVPYRSNRLTTVKRIYWLQRIE